MTRTRWISAGMFAALSYGAAALGAMTMRGRGNPQRSWYRGLRKPRAQPPSSAFGPVWTILYGTIAYAGWRLWRSPRTANRTRALALWGTQLAFNAAWTPLFFGARRPELALADIVALDATAASCALVARKVSPRAAGALVPYLAWIGFATYLNAGIVAKNPKAVLRP